MSPEDPALDRRNILLILLLLTLATVGKIAWAAQSLGTTDTVRFFHFGEELLKHPMAELYATDTRLNHTVTVSGFIKLLTGLTAGNGAAFVLWLRLPGIIADIAIVLELLRQRRAFGLGWGWLALAAASPLHILICGFHGNLDGVVAAGIFFAFSAALSQRPLLSGLILGLACHIKISPVLFAPALAAYWLSRGQAWRFCLSFGLSAGAMVAMGWSVAGVDFAKHVLSYGSIWGNWGIGEALVALGYSIPQIPFKGYTDPLAAVLAPTLKAIIVALAIALAWRGRRGDARALFRTGAVTALVFFALTPGFGHQYLVWWFPLVLVAFPRWAGLLTTAASIFVFATFSAGSKEAFPWHLVEPKLPAPGWVMGISLATWAIFAVAAAATLAITWRPLPHPAGNRGE